MTKTREERLMDEARAKMMRALDEIEDMADIEWHHVRTSEYATLMNAANCLRAYIDDRLEIDMEVMNEREAGLYG